MIPRVMVGTSPFLGAGQFGHRALLYRRTFYHRPENIVTLLEYCAEELGVTGVQALADPVIIGAVREADPDLDVVAVVGLRNLEEELEMLEDLNLRAVLLHASRVDGEDVEEVSAELDEIRGRLDVPVGIATHRPDETLPKWEEAEGAADVYMVPLNPVGAFMGDQKAVEELLAETDRTVIAKKVLAAGSLSPEEGLPYAARYADAVAVGITGEKEAEETLRIAKRYFG
ncbi:hypothetical protein [Methanopyrus sp.]